MADGNSREESTVDDSVLNKLPSIPSSDEVAAAFVKPEPWSPSDESAIDARLNRLRAVSETIVAANRLRRKSSLQGKYVAITPNERDNLEHIQQMTEDITARLDRLRDDGEKAGEALTPPATPDAAANSQPHPQGPLYVPGSRPVRGKFVQVVSFDGCSDRDADPSQREPRPTEQPSLDADFFSSPPLPPGDAFAFMNGDEGMDDDDDVAAASSRTDDGVTEEALERRLRMLTDQRSQ